MDIKRRQALRSLASIPAITALPALAQEPKTPIEEYPKLELTSPEAVVSPAARFFSPTQMATLRRLAVILVPASGNRPGAIEAGASEFLDFLILESPADRQTLYRHGLDHLDSDSTHNFKKNFAALTESEAATLLTPLLSPPAANDQSHFLHAAKDDILRATMNSRQFAAASGGRRNTGVGTYWLPIE